jgi:hypothetical protein
MRSGTCQGTRAVADASVDTLTAALYSRGSVSASLTVTVEVGVPSKCRVQSLHFSGLHFAPGVESRRR